MDTCDNINDCRVIKAFNETVKIKFKDVDERIEVVTSSYESTQTELAENTRHLQAANLAIAAQTEILKGISDSFAGYKSEHENAHTTLNNIDSTLHTRITNARLEISNLKGSINTKIAEKVGSLKVGIAETKVSLQSTVNWKEITKIAGILAVILTAFTAFFKYIIPLIGG